MKDYKRMIRYTDGIKQFRAGMNEPAAASALWLDNMNIDEQLWWGRLFINIHVVQYSGSSSKSRLEPTAHSYWRCMAVCGHCYSRPSAAATPDEY